MFLPMGFMAAASSPLTGSALPSMPGLNLSFDASQPLQVSQFYANAACTTPWNGQGSLPFFRSLSNTGIRLAGYGSTGGPVRVANAVNGLSAIRFYASNQDRLYWDGNGAYGPNGSISPVNPVKTFQGNLNATPQSFTFLVVAALPSGSQGFHAPIGASYLNNSQSTGPMLDLMIYQDTHAYVEFGRNSTSGVTTVDVTGIPSGSANAAGLYVYKLIAVFVDYTQIMSVAVNSTTNFGSTAHAAGFPNDTAAWQTFTLGDQANGTDYNFLDGYLCEVQGWTTAANPNQVSSLMAYANSKWGS